MIGHPAIYAAQALASGLAVALAAYTRAHRPMALLIPAGLAVDVALEPVGPAPVGWRFGVGVALGTVYPWAVLAAVAVVLRGRGLGEPGRDGGACGTCVAEEPMQRAEHPGAVQEHGPGLVEVSLSHDGRDHFFGGEHARHHAPARAIAQALAGWAPCVALILATGIRGPALARVYAGMQAAMALVLVATVVRWRKRREARTVTETCAVICAAAEVANVPAYLGLPSWWSARTVYLACYLGLVVAQAEALCRRSKRSTSSGAPSSS